MMPKIKAAHTRPKPKDATPQEHEYFVESFIVLDLLMNYLRY